MGGRLAPVWTSHDQDADHPPALPTAPVQRLSRRTPGWQVRADAFGPYPEQESVMQTDRTGRKPSGALLLFLAVYIAAIGLLFVPKGTFVSGPATASIASR